MNEQDETRNPLPDPLPPPGLQGHYGGSCVICMRGTNTGIAVVGPAEAAIGFLVGGWGLPSDHAIATLRAGWEEDGYNLAPGEVPAGELKTVFQLCAECAGRGSGRVLPVADVRTGPIPAIKLGK